MTSHPSFGAWIDGNNTRFRVWAPVADTLDVAIYDGERIIASHGLRKQTDGCFTGVVPNCSAGTRYKYRINGGDCFPDPASRFQPEGVHGPSQVIDPRQFQWNDSAWSGIPYENLVIYELHVGTFTPQGTFQGVIDKLEYLQSLGITAVELMPIGDFPGRRNWGYDGVDLYAPARCYGRPDDLRRLVDKAHECGLAVLLDVVYNHLGPDGNYLGVYSPYYNSQRHTSPWGAAMNFDEEHSEMVRAFFIDNALCWLNDFHIDGLRLDATHAIHDAGPKHFLQELAEKVRSEFPDRRIHLIAEDSRNLVQIIQPIERGGWGMDGVWADDLHHQVRCQLAGDNEGYYIDYSGTTEDIAATIRQGWFFTGQHSQYRKGPRGTDPNGVASRSFVVCLQNHDQIGNRAFGERLHHQTDLAAWRAASALLLCLPQTPLLFMGQEWAATTPFLFFTDHKEELGKLVTEGRRREFQHFSAFTDPENRERIPDPQAEATFLASRLEWEEANKAPHAGILRLCQELLALRHSERAFAVNDTDDDCSFWCSALTKDAITLTRDCIYDLSFLIVIQLRSDGVVELPVDENLITNADPRWTVVLHTEEERFVANPQPPRLKLTGVQPSIEFARPGAVLLKEKT